MVLAATNAIVGWLKLNCLLAILLSIALFSGAANELALPSRCFLVAAISASRASKDTLELKKDLKAELGSGAFMGLVDFVVAKVVVAAAVFSSLRSSVLTSGTSS